MMEITVAPYLAATDNHATMDETAKINLTPGFVCISESVLIWDVDDDGQRGEAEKKKRIISC